VNQNSQKDEHIKIITDLKAKLSDAYTTINNQEEHITKLQAQLSHNQTVLQKITQTSTQESTINNPSDTKATGQTQYPGRKKVPIPKKKSDKLSRIQFASLVTFMVVLTTSIGFLLIQKKNQNNPPQPTSGASSTTKTQTESPSTSLPSLPSSISTPVYPSPVLTNIPQTVSSPITVTPVNQQENLNLVYNVKTPPNLQKSEKLQRIVDDIVATVTSEKLSNKPLSITLIDIKKGKYAEYQQDIPRFPASVVKMFWMTYLYANIEKGTVNEAELSNYTNLMIKKSDNNSASYIVDKLTYAQSGQNLEGKDFEDWLNRREQMNSFFINANYQNINISQKVFPITYQKILQPTGADLKMRGKNPDKPIRNKITTQQAARLLYEISQGKAISPTSSQKMFGLLSIDAETRIVKKDDQNQNEFNPVRGYFSESLPLDVNIASKAGWTSNTRQETAYITTPDGKAAYILTVFAEDRSYAYNWKIFPQISRIVYNRMTQ
jgi:Beta-lactamase enzyme family